MRLLLAATTILASSFALACPNLTGTYECKYENDSYTTTISQREEAGVTIYTADGDDMRADGVATPYTETDDSEMTVNGIRTAICSGDSLVIDDTSEYLKGTEKLGDIAYQMTVTADVEGLHTAVVGTANFNGQKDEFNETQNCARQ